MLRASVDVYAASNVPAITKGIMPGKYQEGMLNLSLLGSIGYPLVVLWVFNEYKH